MKVPQSKKQLACSLRIPVPGSYIESAKGLRSHEIPLGGTPSHWNGSLVNATETDFQK